MLAGCMCAYVFGADGSGCAGAPGAGTPGADVSDTDVSDAGVSRAVVCSIGVSVLRGNGAL